MTALLPKEALFLRGKMVLGWSSLFYGENRDLRNPTGSTTWGMVCEAASVPCRVEAIFVQMASHMERYVGDI